MSTGSAERVTLRTSRATPSSRTTTSSGASFSSGMPSSADGRHEQGALSGGALRPSHGNEHGQAEGSGHDERQDWSHLRVSVAGLAPPLEYSRGLSAPPFGCTLPTTHGGSRSPEARHMPSPLSSLLLAMSLGVLSAGAAAQTPSTAPTAQPPSRPAAAAPTRQRPRAPPQTPATTAKTSGGKAPAGKAAGKPSSWQAGHGEGCQDRQGRRLRHAGSEGRGHGKPPPVAADPLAPTLAPCAEPTRKP